MAKQPSNHPGKPQAGTGNAPQTASKPGGTYLFDPFQPPPISQRRWDATPEMAAEVRAVAKRAKLKLWTAAALVAAAGIMVGVVYLLFFLDAERHASAFLKSEFGRGLGIDQEDLADALPGAYLTAAIVGGTLLVLSGLMLKFPITGAAIAFLLLLIPQVILVAMVGPNILTYEWYWPAGAIALVVVALLLAHSGKQDRMSV